MPATGDERTRVLRCERRGGDGLETEMDRRSCGSGVDGLADGGASCTATDVRGVLDGVDFDFFCFIFSDFTA